jgi:prolipoprotein diacylglyceryl transferase
MASHSPLPPASFLPSPSVNGFHLGPVFVHFYGLMYVVGIVLAIVITQRRVRAAGGDPSLVADLATWSVPAGIIGGRIYFDITTPADIPHHWWGVFAVWSGGLGIWGGITAGALVGAWRVRRHGGSVVLFMDAVAPALLVAQAVGRIGNYFNQELFGKPSGLPWALQISLLNRPAGYRQFSTFQPTFLYELIFDLALAAALVWLGHHRGIRAPGLFALYVTGYSAFRIFEESLRIDSSQHFLGLRLNFYVAAVVTLAGLGWFVLSQRRAPRPEPAGPEPAGPEPARPEPAGTSGGASAADGPEAAIQADAPSETGAAGKLDESSAAEEASETSTAGAASKARAADGAEVAGATGAAERTSPDGRTGPPQDAEPGEGGAIVPSSATSP